MQGKADIIDSTSNVIAAPAPLIVYMTGIDPVSIQGRLSATALIAPPESVDSAVLAALAKSGQSAVIIYRTAEDYLVAAMDESRKPTAALSDWIREAEEILRARNQRRRQISLIRDQHLLAGDSKSLGALQNLAVSAPVAGAGQGEPAATALLHRVMARQIVAESARAEELGQELEASGLPWLAPSARLDMDAIYDGYGTPARADATAREAMLQDQLAHLQDEIANRVQQADEEREIWQKRLTNLTATAEAARAEVAAAKASLADGKREIETLQRSIKKLSSELRQAQDAKSVAQRHAASLEAERRTVFASTSWKITRPLRAVKEMFGGRADKKIV